MTIAQVKQVLQAKTTFPFPVLQMVQQKDEAKVPQPWFSHWDNDHRIRVVMAEDIFNKIKANPEFDGLALKSAVVKTTEKGDYMTFTVITPKDLF